MSGRRKGGAPTPPNSPVAKRSTTVSASSSKPANSGRAAPPPPPPMAPLPKSRSSSAPMGLKPKASELQAEIQSRADRRASHLGSLMGESQFNKRPAKPDSLKAKDASGKSLTAHHMLPHSTIKSEFLSAVRTQNTTALQNISTMGDNSIDSADAYRKLAVYKSDPGRTERELSSLYKEVSWDSNNVFMGPSPEQRTDDPGSSGVDVRRTASGDVSKASRIAQNLQTHGFGGIKPQDLASDRAASRSEASALRPYKPSDWESSGTKSIGKGAKRRTIDTFKQK